ncbi:hypothetical protein B0T17DRAFT_483336 [Bombardia bombarda]|uniref:dolichol kinase n=1 Tax=Bombardia bombarda TaxID=252184 RepID=A0AA39XKY1_9PEZI|nr:hypothetical protein B0T17DRAFT_483336 [Bombardia bombarda]
MPEHLQPPAPAPAPASPPPPVPPSSNPDDHPDDDLRHLLSRSPHPYHRQSFELLEPSDRLINRATATIQTTARRPPSPSAFAKDSTPASDSGTEADDEHFLKGLPAPKARLHKGLRGKNEFLSGSSTPLLSPVLLEDEGGRRTVSNLSHGSFERDKRSAAERVRRRKELVRRGAEVLLLVCQGAMLASNRQVQPFIRFYRKELVTLCQMLCILAAAYPVRLVIWAYRWTKPTKLVPIRLPSSFDPAPMLYPPLIPIFVSLLVAPNVMSVVPLNLVLGICALPRALVPGSWYWETYSSSHWLLSCIPCFLESHVPGSTGLLRGSNIPSEVMVLIYPLHQSLCLILQQFTTTSLLTAEIQLLSVALINVLLLAQSPQAVVLKAVLWGGGLGLTILCSRVIQWGISLARVPKWRFRRAVPPSKGTSPFRLLRQLWFLRGTRHEPKVDYEDALSDSGNSASEYTIGQSHLGPPTYTKHLDSISDGETAPAPAPAINTADIRFSLLEPLSQTTTRRHTLPSFGRISSRFKTSTPSGRRKRSASSSVRAFFSLTQAQATLRKWIYAGYVYVCIVVIALVGIRDYVQRYALSGNEPVGWALGYLFGDVPRFRFEVVKANLERWICLPPRWSDDDGDEHLASCYTGWAQHVRHASLGEANTRLFLSAYWLVIIVFGLAVVFQLSPVYEVDTRRKVFHFMMVAMFLPMTYIDPAYVALALSLVLAIFLLLDLLRASQLPPLSKPIARFLTPYVDGRDLRGPVVISHIFLLIGCAIPLWLSLAALPRSAASHNSALTGWEVPTRDVSMVSGVVCVGLGDAAASLIGRRWGHRKWLWGGGKSIEGSVAFAVAVFLGLMTANVWLRFGGWPLAGVL